LIHDRPICSQLSEHRELPKGQVLYGLCTPCGNFIDIGRRSTRPSSPSLPCCTNCEQRGQCSPTVTPPNVLTVTTHHVSGVKSLLAIFCCKSQVATAGCQRRHRPEHHRVIREGNTPWPLRSVELIIRPDVPSTLSVRSGLANLHGISAPSDAS